MAIKKIDMNDKQTLERKIDLIGGMMLDQMQTDKHYSPIERKLVREALMKLQEGYKRLYGGYYHG